MKKKMMLLMCLLVPSFVMASTNKANKAFAENCSSYINKEKRISSITLGAQNVSNKRAYFTITLRNNNTNESDSTNEISVSEPIINYYGQAMFKLMNTAYLSNSVIKITSCESDKISGVAVLHK